ncbi:DUF2306 domain-containing protein [Actinoplanes sp. NPDC026623]|uniref:DUF2306 domain-containing protein n=1 Tax=Actinoplanes sp. NPDC026623 TaxID=3155610 RepID=UPI0033FD81B1
MKWKWLLFAVAMGAGVALAFPYLSLDVGRSRLDVPGGLHYAILVVHVFTAAVALVLGPVQFLRRVRIHGVLGRVYLLGGVLPAAVTAVPVAVWSGQTLTQVGLITAAVLWLVTAGLAYRAARRRDFAAHRAWMMRNYALTFLAVTARLLTPLLLVARVAAGGTADVASTIPGGQTIGWLVNLVVAEILIRRMARPSGRTGR